MRWLSPGTVLSLALHAGVAAGLVALPKRVTTKTTMVGVLEKKKKEDKKEPARDDAPPPPPKPIEPPRRAAPRPRPAVENTPPPAAAPAPAAAHAALSALPSLGIAMSGGTGMGLGVPTGPVGGDPAARPVEAPRPAARIVDDCTEKAGKPRPLGGVPQPEYTSAARSAGVEGKVRITIQVDETGKVTGAQVSSGLGYGLDEAALSVAGRLTVSPATRCGKPVAATFALSFRFETG